MVKKLFACFLLSTLILMGKSASASTSSIMMNAEDGSVMYEMNADESRYPASLTKLMTLYITFNALENGHIKLSDKLKVSRTAAGRSPSKLGVRAGSTITVKDAIMAVIVKSANDCATVLAEHFSKTEADFAVLMTKTAQKLGMKHTIFKNASGLPNSKQKTTARDMATLAMAVYHHFPQYYSWFSVNSFKYQGQTITGHNHLLKTFSGADGMKTGYTAASGYNIITSAKRHNKRVIVVTMGHKYVNDRDKRAALMMDKGLIELKKSDVVNVASLKQEIDGVKTTKTAQSNTLKSKTKRPIVNVVSTAKKKPLPQKSAVSVASKSGNSRASGTYAVQVGSFSDYKRAQSHASGVKNKLAEKYAVYDTKVEKVSVFNGYMYRSKIVGLNKQDAKAICQNMKQKKQSCLVVADNSSVRVARK